MLSVCFFLGLLALVFAILGFLLHAFYFSRGTTQAEEKELSDLRKSLAEKQKETLEAREEIAKTNHLLHSLEQQIHRRNEEMERLRQWVARQDQEISLLQKDAEAIRTMATDSADAQNRSTLAPTGAASDVVESAGSLAAPPEVPAVSRDVQSVTSAPKASEWPAWRENLDNILGMLDAMEKEVDK